MEQWRWLILQTMLAATAGIPGMLSAQCGPTVPSFNVDLTASPSQTWTSPSIQRNGQCCGSSAPDQCLRFSITLHPDAQGINFVICEGAVPPGALFYQIDCGPPVQVGQPICLNGPGPHVLTFCKPGNNTNRYCITSVPAPSVGPGQVLNDGCTGILTSTGFAPGTIQWTSVAPGGVGSYNGSIGCTTCATTSVTGQAGYPAWVDYRICGMAISPCSNNSYCDTVRVWFNPTLLADIIPLQPTVCSGASGTTITVVGGGGTPPYSYLWNTGASTASIFVGPGNYTVQLSDASNCPPTSTSVTVTQFQQPIQALAGPDILVCGQAQPVVVLGGAVTGASGGIWSGGQGQFTPSTTSLNASYTPTTAELAAGHVQLFLASTGNGTCPGSIDTVDVHISIPLIPVVLSATAVSCNGGSNGSIMVSPVLPAWTFTWSHDPSLSGPMASNLSAGAYSVTIVDSLGCDTSLTMVILQPPPLSVAITSSNNVSCYGGQNGSASAQAAGGSPAYTYLWTGSMGAQTGPIANGLGAGSYTLQVADVNGCTAQANVMMGQPPPLVLSAQVPDTVCVNAPLMLTAQASGGQGPLLVMWNGIGTGTALNWSFATSQTVSVTVTDAAGCTGPVLNFPIYVLDLAQAQLTATGGGTVCPGSSVQLSAQLNGYPGTYTLTWPTLNLTGPGPFSVPVAASSVHPVVATDGCGNSLSTQLMVNLETPPNILLPATLATGCAPLTFTMPDLQLPGPLTYLWQLGNGTTSINPRPTVTYPTGQFSVTLTVSTPAGCSSTSTTPGTITAHAAPSAAFTADPWTTDIDHATIDLSSQSTGGVASVHWDFGDGSTSAVWNPSHTYTDIGTFDVELWVQNIHGCVDSITRPVIITPVYDIVIPNVFTPNTGAANGGVWVPGELSNDVFYPFTRFVKDYRLRVFNRWGELVFESDELSTGWDGWYRGRPSPQDVYVYQIWVRFVDNKESMRLGDVTLLR